MYIKTEKLPIHFIILGYVLLITGIWRCFAGDWKCIFWLVISLFCLLMSEGIVINSNSKIIKNYISILLVRFIKKKETGPVEKIVIRKTNRKENMSVASITRTYNTFSYSLTAVYQDGETEIMEGSEKKVHKVAKNIASMSGIEILEEG